MMPNIHRVSAGIFAVLAFLLLSSCGASTSASKPAFVNQTTLQDGEFQPLAASTWQQAQTQTATQWTDLWAAYRVLQNEPAAPGCYTGAISCEGFIPPDTSATSVAAEDVVITAVADVPAGADTGIIACPGGTGYCDAYVQFDSCSIYIPTSKPDNMGPYEMQNCILHKLGYDTSRR
jgi:hypothetical protein